MARDLDSYSRTISWLKVALPIVGLGILSLLFLVARQTRIEQGELSPEALSPGGGIESVAKPDYSGVTGDGAGVSVQAEAAWPRPDESGILAASRSLARFDLPDGETIDVRANEAALRPGDEVLAMRGDVVVETGSGWTLRSEALDARLDWTRLESPGKVRSEGPIGTLDGGRMLIWRDNPSDRSYVMEFDKGVHLVYLP